MKKGRLLKEKSVPKNGGNPKMNAPKITAIAILILLAGCLTVNVNTDEKGGIKNVGIQALDTTSAPKAETPKSEIVQIYEDPQATVYGPQNASLEEAQQALDDFHKNALANCTPKHIILDDDGKGTGYLSYQIKGWDGAIGGSCIYEFSGKIGNPNNPSDFNGMVLTCRFSQKDLEYYSRAGLNFGPGSQLPNFCNIKTRFLEGKVTPITEEQIKKFKAGELSW